MNPEWTADAVFYHIYPLGLCDAPAHNDFSAPPQPRLDRLHGWLDHIQDLGANALYLGPLFESSRHGYDTADYTHVDRRLGTDETLRTFSAEVHRRGMRLVLDGVFNHVGRDFWAFRDVLAHGPESPYADWFAGLRFGESSPFGDPFRYEGWNGPHSLVKLNLSNPAVVEHLFGAVRSWVAQFGIDGLRLDAADSLDFDFLRQIGAFCRGLKPDFWLMGEVVHGDYRRWANPAMLDAVTNYEAYKGLYSSHVDRNYFEIAYTLDRQFGSDGLYRGLRLYAFADNHDVNRVASNLTDPADLYPLYCLLFTMPGVPSIYYGSEWGLAGARTEYSDAVLRPNLDLADMTAHPPHPELAPAITRLAHLRRSSPALQSGDYRQLALDHEHLAFVRQTPEETVLVVVNAAARPFRLDLPLDGLAGRRAVDLLDPGQPIPVRGGRLHADPIWPHWARVLRLEA